MTDGNHSIVLDSLNKHIVEYVMPHVFGMVDNDTSIPAKVIKIYVDNTCEGVLKDKHVVDNVVGYILRCLSHIENTAGKVSKTSKVANNAASKHKKKQFTMKNNSSRRNLKSRLENLVLEACSPENRPVLVDILRNNRLVLYLTQYAMIQYNANPKVNANYTHYLHELTEDRTYEKNNNGNYKTRILPCFLLLHNYFISYLVIKYYIHKKISGDDSKLLNNDLITYMTKDTINSTNVVQNVLSTKKVFNNTNTEKIKATFVSYHGLQLEELCILPKNKIFIVITPLNRLAKMNDTNKNKEIFKKLLSKEHIKKFVSCYPNYINTLTDAESGEHDCLLDGMQVYYGGQAYFDIYLSSYDPTEGADMFNLDIKTNTYIEYNIPTIDTKLSKIIKDDNIPEIIVVNSCRPANKVIENNLQVELIYRYTKIHDILVDKINTCKYDNFEGIKTSIYGSSCLLHGDYTQYYIKQKDDIIIPQNEYLLLNKSLSPIRNKLHRSVSNYVDYILNKPYDNLTDTYIDYIYSKSYSILELIAFITIDYVPKFIKIYNTLYPNTNYRHIYYIFYYNQKACGRLCIYNMYELLIKPNPISDIINKNLFNILQNLSSYDTEQHTKAYTDSENIKKMCMNLISSNLIHDTVNGVNLDNLKIEILTKYLRYSANYYEISSKYIMKYLLFNLYLNGSVSHDVIIDKFIYNNKSIHLAINSINDLFQTDYQLDFLNKYLLNLYALIYELCNMYAMRIPFRNHINSEISEDTENKHCIAELLTTYIFIISGKINILTTNTQSQNNGIVSHIISCLKFLIYVYKSDYFTSDKVDIESYITEMLNVIDAVKITATNLNYENIQDIEKVCNTMILVFINRNPSMLTHILSTIEYYNLDIPPIHDFNPNIEPEFRKILKPHKKNSKFIDLLTHIFPDWNNANSFISDSKSILPTE